MATTSAGLTAASQPTSGISTPQFHTRSRTQSISSDRPSTIMSIGLMSPCLSVTPEAAFIAASAASQIVTNDHDNHADTWYDQHGIEPAGETAMVSAPALQLVNSFLDQLLFNFLSASRATTLAALRPAVSEVLKPKLAKDAINQADEELREYLGDADEDDFVQPQGAGSRDWDLELVWKRTRLRCMVYSSLGDMEEEDEDYHMDQENLKPDLDERGHEVISPAVAIFLTSILEYIGEQALVIAGQAAYYRLRAKFEKEPKSTADIADRIVVEELDMERVALDRTLGRLWRAWKKRIRSPNMDPRPFSRASSVRYRQGSTPENRESPLPEEGLGIQEAPREESEIQHHNDRLEASAIPLPIGDRDIDEIEVPGLASYSDEEDSGREEEEPPSRRPKSLMIFTSQPSDGMPTPTMSQPHTPIAPSGRKRSNSLPTPSSSPYTSPVLKRAGFDPIDTDLANQQARSGEKEISTEAVLTDLQPAGRSQASLPGVLAPVQESGEMESQAEIEKAPEPKPRNPNRLSRLSLDSKPHPKSVEEESGDIDDFTEEPEICTSSRVSIAGRSSPSNSESGRAVVVAPKVLQRTPSVHSARVVDVHGPKSPVMVSRTSSVGASDRPVDVPRANSGSRAAPPIVVEAQKAKPAEIDVVIRSSSSTPRTRSPVEKLSRKQNTSESISEVDEDAEIRPTRQNKARTETASSPTSASGTPNTRPSQASSNSVQQTTSPRHDHTSSMTKVTILSDTHGTIAEDRVSSPRNRSQTIPSVPERNTGRPAAQVVHSPTASVGAVAIERPAAGHDSPDRSRHLRTSGSSGSSSTGKIRAVRSSEESKASCRADNLPRNFEELIQSDETIQYTLTPESMRNLDGNRAQTTSPSTGHKSRRSEDALTFMNGERNRPASSMDVRRTVSVSRATGFSSHPPDAKYKGFVPKAPAGTSLARPKTGGPQARDARVPRDNAINDFADFIRSTGPAAENGPAPLRNVSGPVAPPIRTNVEPKPVLSANRPRLQARDAAVDNREDNSDLIDFIRRGPPNANNPRIPRTVAPFRTTMDSDQMSGAVGGKAVDASLPDIRYSQTSTTATDTTQPSIQSSINSQSALLQNRPNAIDEEDTMPKRTRRRVRDPYAIDLSDEDEEDYAQAVRPPPSKEESLADFLRNYSPPPEPVSVPQNIPKRKASAPSLIGRFSRKDSNAGSNGAKSAKVDSRSLNSRAGGGHGHVPIQIKDYAGEDKYATADTTGNRSAMQSSAGRVPMKRFEPREAVSSTTRTNDLAAFLRNAEPPQSTPAARPGPSIEPQQQSSSSGFSKMFGRRKKPSLA
ncbi:hypothetical protein LY76DRAFT_91603 [Colletotrichum caudatum]|nr:hypothetical protein LY76DRAFT_91603 [Colletotrichum caudatum]